MSSSLDGFVAGAEQSLDDPLGKRGGELHGWHIGDSRATEADKTATGSLMRTRGAYVIGRKMFGPIRGPWDEAWDGWWGPSRPTTPRPSCSLTTPTNRSAPLTAHHPYPLPQTQRRLSTVVSGWVRHLSDGPRTPSGLRQSTA